MLFIIEEVGDFTGNALKTVEIIFTEKNGHKSGDLRQGRVFWLKAGCEDTTGGEGEEQVWSF
jgi:hypothetical protein